MLANTPTRCILIAMEKNKQHHNLSAIKAMIRSGQYSVKRSALDGAADLGFTLDEMRDVVLNLTYDDFDKSMTEYADHRAWQDVYKPWNKIKGRLYVKITVIEKVKTIIVSFKKEGYK